MAVTALAASVKRGDGREGRVARIGSLIRPRTLFGTAIVIVIAYLSLTPLIYLLHGTFFEEGRFTFAGFERAYATSGIGAMVRNSIVFSVGSSLVAFVTGTALAYVCVRTNAPFRALMFAIALVPLIVPGLLYTIAWIMLGSENVGLVNQFSNAVIGRPIIDIFSMRGMVWVEGTHSAPLVFLFMVAAFKSMDPSLEESALVSGASRFTMIRRITVPLSRPAISGAMLITVVRAVEGFEVPALLGLPDRIFVFSSRIYFELRQYPYDYNAAGALSLGLIGMSILGVVLVSRMRGNAKEYATVTGKGFRPGELDLGWWRWVVGGGVIVYFVITTVLPVAVLIYNSLLPYYRKFNISDFNDLSLVNYRKLFGSELFTRAVRNSLLLSVGSATAIMLLTSIAAWIVLRARLRGRQMIDQLTFLPLIVPGLVLGVSISFVYLRSPLPFPIYGTIFILLIAYVTKYIPYGMRYALPSLQQISPELEESAAVSGASWGQTARKVIFPLMIPGLMAGWVYIVIVAMREFSSSILLYSSGSEVLSVLTFQFYEMGDLVTVSALGVFLVATLVIIVGIAYKLGARLGLS